MVFILVWVVLKKLCKFNGINQLLCVIEGVRFINGVVVDDVNCYGWIGSFVCFVW